MDKHAAKLCFKEGTRIFSIGEEGRDAYLVKKGKVSLTVDKNCNDVVVGEISEGGLFGEMAMLAGDIRLVNATAMEYTEVIPVDPARVETLLEETPPAIKALLRVMARTAKKLTLEN